MSGPLSPADAFEPAPASPALRPAPEPATFGEVFSASRLVARPDRIDNEQLRLNRTWSPILEALDLPESDNPALFYDSVGRPSSFDRSPSIVKPGLTRTQQQMALLAEIRRRRLENPALLPDVPAALPDFTAWMLDQERQRTAAAADVVSRGQGVGGALAALAGGAAEMALDSPNLASLPLGGGGKTLLGVAAREALIGGVVEAAQQPALALNRAERGETLSIGEAAANVGLATVGSAVLGTGLELGARGGLAGYDATVARIFEAMPEGVQRKWADRMKVRTGGGDVPIGEFWGGLSNREAAELARDMIGETRLSADEQAAIAVLERDAETAESSPFAAGPAGDAAHEAGLGAALRAILDDRPPARQDPGATGPAPGRAAVPTSGRPQSPALAEGREAFKAKVRRAEEGDGYNERSGAMGPYQFMPETWTSLYRRRFPGDPRSDAEIAALRRDEDLNAVLIDDLIDENAAILERAGQAPSAGNLYLVHFLGPRAAKVLAAEPATPIERLVPASFLEDNPEVLGGGKSASEVVAWAHRQMGGDAAAVPVRAGYAHGGAVQGGDQVAQLRAEALELQSQAIGEAPVAGGDTVPAMHSGRFRPGDLLVDPETFQFKAGGDEYGVTDRLAGITEWNPIYAGRLVVWERIDGKPFVADGHQRSGLARRIEAQSGAEIWLDAVVLREADGVSAQEARTWAALKNIAEGTGSPVDAAKVIRDAGEDVLKDLPPKSALVRDGAALSRLSDEAFGTVWNGRISAELAAVVGHLVDNPEAHLGMIDLLIKLNPANRGQAESVVRQAIAAGYHRETQTELFGAREMVSTLFLERAKVLERGLARLRKAKLIYGTAAKEADTLERVGSKIARSKTEKEAARNAEALEVVSRLAFSKGPVADALNLAAEQLAGGASLADAVAGFVATVRDIDLQAAARGAGTDDSGRLAPDGAGRGGDAGDEGQALPAQPGDPGEPGLASAAELEEAGQVSIFDEAQAARFSDPDGEAAKVQADSLEHDLRMAIARIPAVDAPPAPGETFTVLRAAIESDTSLAGRNAADVAGIATHLQRVDDWEAPGTTGDNPTHIHVYEVTVDKEFGPYQQLNQAQRALAEDPADAPVGRGKFGAGAAYAFPNNAGYQQRLVDSVPVADVRAVLDEMGLSSFDEAGSALGAEAINEALRRRLGEPARHGLDIYADVSKQTRERLGLKPDPEHPVTGEPLFIAKIRARQLRDSFAPVDAGETPGTHNIPQSAPVAGGGTRGELREAIVAGMMAAPAAKGREAHIVLGPPAAGKSTLAEPLAAARGLRIIDSDDAKAQLPEFEDGIGAMAVHEESALLAAEAAARSIAAGDNLLLPLVGKTYDGVEARLAELLEAGYTVHLHLVDLPGAKAVERATTRYAATGRLVDPDYVAAVGDRPRLTFERLIKTYGEDLGGHVHVSNDVPFGETPKLIDASDGELAARLGFDRTEGASEGAGGPGGEPAGAARQDLPSLDGASPAAIAAALDRGPAVDPAIAVRQRQELELGAAAPLRQVEADQRGEMGLALFDAADQPTFRLEAEGEERSAEDLLAELDDDEAAIAAIEACMTPGKAAA